jgi:hypothetical protein
MALVKERIRVRRLKREISLLTSESPEIRIVLETFSSLFSLLHQYRRSSRNLDRLGSLFVGAYEAELGTLTPRPSPGCADLKKAALDNRILLFQIMLEMARGCDHRFQPRLDDRTDRLATRIGRVFTLVDDFADLASDSRTGSANTILIALDESGIGHDDWRTELYRAQIERSKAALCDDLAWVGDQLKGRIREDKRSEVFHSRLLLYVRSWLG